MWFLDPTRVDDVAAVLGTWAGFWFASLFLPLVFTRADSERVLSTIHAVVSCWFAWQGDAHILKFALGYFLWDVTYLTVHFERWDFMLHAVMCTASFAIAMTPFMPLEAMGVLLFEMSTPFMNMFRAAQSHRCHIMIQVGLFALFTLVYFSVRVVWGSYVLIWDVMLVTDRWSVVGLAIVAEGLNLWWFYNICKKIRAMIK